MNVRTTDMDPSEWVKPKQQRPVRRSLYGALRKESNVKCLILTGLIYGCIVAIVWCRVTRVTKVDIDFTAFPITSTREISPCDDGTIYIPTAFVVMLYLLYLVECWHCKAWHQLKFEKTDLNSAYQKIHEVSQAQPVVWWKAVCYHYVRRTREVTRNRNGNAYTCTQVYYERVNSHVAAGCFFFALCGMKDVSRELIDLEKHAATKIQLSKGFLFANHATAREFQEQRAAFFQEQERFDDYMEMREGMDLSNVHFKESLISWSSPDNPPWFAKIPVFWLCNFLLLSWPLRLILELNTGHVHYQVNKLFGVNYMTPSGSELLLTAPRSHGLPINNHQYRIHNRAISSHHSRLTGDHHHHNQYGSNRRRRSLLGTNTDIDHDDTAPLLPSTRHEEGAQNRAQQPSQNEKELTELSSGSFKNLKDQHSNNNYTSPSSSSGRIFFPHVPRRSFFSRNFRFSRENGCKLTRSVTLLMTKPERLEFLASTQQQFPDEFGYYGDSDEGARLLHNENGCYYPNCSSPPPPPFLTPSPEEEGEEGTNNEDNRRLTHHHHHHHHNHRPSSFGDVGNSSNCLAPSYSQALLLMEPSERDSVIAYFRNSEKSSRNNPSEVVSLVEPPPSSSSFSHNPSEGPTSITGLDPNLTNEQVHQQEPSGFINVTGVGNDRSDPRGTGGAQASHEAILSSSLPASALKSRAQHDAGAHYLHLGRSNSSQYNCPTGTTTSSTTANPSLPGEDVTTTTTTTSRYFTQDPPPFRAISSDVNPEVGDEDTTSPPYHGTNHPDEDLCASHERSSTTGHPCPSTSSVTTGHSYHYHHRASRLPSSGSSMVLNTVAPREITGVQIDLTQPIVVTVPRDPLRESTSSSSSSGGGRVSSSSTSTSTAAPSYSRSSSRRAHANFLRHTDANDEPPTYFEALKTSRPVFLPSLARIRRCFTERDIASRFSSNRGLWFDEIADVEGSCGRSGNNTYRHHQHHGGNAQACGGSSSGGGGGATTTSRV